jgi:hypothetical protein
MGTRPRAKSGPIPHWDRSRSSQSRPMHSAGKKKRHGQPVVMITFRSPSAHVNYWRRLASICNSGALQRTDRRPRTSRSSATGSIDNSPGDSSSTDDSRLGGALPQPDSCSAANRIAIQSNGGQTVPSRERDNHQRVRNLICDRHRNQANASKSTLASRRSAVSKPSLNQPWIAASNSWAAARLPWRCQRRLRLTAARSSSDFACW